MSENRTLVTNQEAHARIQSLKSDSYFQKHVQSRVVPKNTIITFSINDKVVVMGKSEHAGTTGTVLDTFFIACFDDAGFEIGVLQRCFVKLDNIEFHERRCCFTETSLKFS